jgi:hypothetical protein
VIFSRDTAIKRIQTGKSRIAKKEGNGRIASDGHGNTGSSSNFPRAEMIKRKINLLTFHTSSAYHGGMCLL